MVRLNQKLNNYLTTVNDRKFQTLLFLFSSKILVIRAGIHKKYL